MTTGHRLLLKEIPMFQHYALSSYALTCALLTPWPLTLSLLKCELPFNFRAAGEGDLDHCHQFASTENKYGSLSHNSLQSNSWSNAADLGLA